MPKTADRDCHREERSDVAIQFCHHEERSDVVISKKDSYLGDRHGTCGASRRLCRIATLPSVARDIKKISDFPFLSAIPVYAV